MTACRHRITFRWRADSYADGRLLAIDVRAAGGAAESPGGWFGSGCAAWGVLDRLGVALQLPAGLRLCCGPVDGSGRRWGVAGCGVVACGP